MKHPSVAQKCPNCKEYARVPAKEGGVRCPACGKEWGKIDDPDKIFEHCPGCGNRQFYLQKDFNQLVGCLIMLIGILLVPKTYGLSLPVMAAVDWLLYRRYPTIAVCYRCGMEFHGFVYPKHLKPFLHHIGLKYDKYR